MKVEILSFQQERTIPFVPLNDILPPLLRKWFFRRCLLPSPYKTVRNLTYQYRLQQFFRSEFPADFAEQAA